MPRLRAAVWSKNVNVVSRLRIEPGIYVDATDYLDSTALHHACRQRGQDKGNTGGKKSNRGVYYKVNIYQVN